MTILVLRTLCLLFLLLPATAAKGQDVDWKTTVGEAQQQEQEPLVWCGGVTLIFLMQDP